MASAAADQISYGRPLQRWSAGTGRPPSSTSPRPRALARRFSDLDRRAAVWNYSLFFHGEDSVADNLSPFIDAAPREEQKYFLATQQADEVRHAVFFNASCTRWSSAATARWPAGSSDPRAS